MFKRYILVGKASDYQNCIFPRTLNTNNADANCFRPFVLSLSRHRRTNTLHIWNKQTIFCLLIRPYLVLTPVPLESAERLMCFDKLSTNDLKLKSRINVHIKRQSLSHFNAINGSRQNPARIASTFPRRIKPFGVDALKMCITFDADG
jgi:hypothetical protein